MKYLRKMFHLKNIGCGYLYFYIHFINEVACFYFLNSIIGDSVYLWVLFLLYDILAFLPQGIIGNYCDKHKNNVAFIGIIFLILAILLHGFNLDFKYLSLVILCIGNSFIHVGGAEATIRSSNGKLSHSAIYVAGGSFGIVVGKILAMLNIHFLFIELLILTTIPFILLANTYKQIEICDNFNCHNKNISRLMIIILAFIIVTIRGYMGYAIPTSWNQTIIEAVLLYSFMGIGKALGGILSDYYGIKKVALLSNLISLPLLLLGNNNIILSLIGIMLFSMNMPITLALLVSALPKRPGLAFGITTIALFLGTLPVFFFRVINLFVNSIIIIIMTTISLIIFKIIIKEGINE